MHVLALSGSGAKQSINHQLLAHAMSLLPEGSTFELVSVRDLRMPFVSQDEQRENGIPADLVQLHQKMLAADAAVIASPEHNGSIPAVLKNALDWLSLTSPGKPWLPRPLALLATSPGGYGGASNLATMAKLVPWWGAKLAGTFSLGSFYEHVQDGQIRDAAKRTELQQLMVKLGEPAAATSSP